MQVGIYIYIIYACRKHQATGMLLATCSYTLGLVATSLVGGVATTFNGLLKYIAGMLDTAHIDQRSALLHSRSSH